MSGSVGYYISPKAKVTLCGQTADANSCFGVFHSSEGLSIGVTAYWRRRCIFGCTDKVHGPSLEMFIILFCFDSGLLSQLCWDYQAQRLSAHFLRRFYGDSAQLVLVAVIVWLMDYVSIYKMVVMGTTQSQEGSVDAHVNHYHISDQSIHNA